MGGTGVIGSALAAALRGDGHDVSIVTRQRVTSPGLIRWDTRRGFTDLSPLEDLDALFHLGGAPLAARPWTRRRRRVLTESRIDSTETLIEALGQLDVAPRCFIGVSATGFYGECGERRVDETDPRGEGFLAGLAHAWEQAHLEARQVGCRVTVLRLSPVLAPHGGAFPSLRRPFRIMPGWVGNGQQWNGWISSRDCVGALRYLAEPERACHGIFNGSVPEPVRNRNWCEALGRVLGRRVYTHAPKWVIRGAFGDLAKELLLASIRVVPNRLMESGYRFRDTEPEPTFRWLVDSITESAGPED